MVDKPARQISREEFDLLVAYIEYMRAQKRSKEAYRTSLDASREADNAEKMLKTAEWAFAEAERTGKWTFDDSDPIAAHVEE